MEFYSLKHRRKIAVDDGAITTRIIEKQLQSGGIQERYMLEATATVDGQPLKMHKFVSRSTFDEFASRT